MSRLSFRFTLGLIIASAVVAPAARAARELVSIEYFCPVTFQLTLKRELPPTQTSKGTANAVSTTRLGNRELLQPLVAQYGGKLSDWSIVAYSDTDALDNFGDIVIMARGKGGALYPLASLDLATITYLSANSNAYSITRGPDDELLRATFEQMYAVTWQHALAGGAFVGNGTIANTLLFGPVKIGNLGIRAHKPKSAQVLLNGIFTPADGDNAVAELSIKIGAPRLVPLYVSTGGSSGGTIVITPSDGGVEVSAD